VHNGRGKAPLTSLVALEYSALQHFYYLYYFVLMFVVQVSRQVSSQLTQGAPGMQLIIAP
jgi:hypothetical protein